MAMSRLAETLPSTRGSSSRPICPFPLFSRRAAASWMGCIAWRKQQWRAITASRPSPSPRTRNLIMSVWTLTNCLIEIQPRTLAQNLACAFARVIDGALRTRDFLHRTGACGPYRGSARVVQALLDCARGRLQIGGYYLPKCGSRIERPKTGNNNDRSISHFALACAIITSRTTSSPAYPCRGGGSFR
jgi:hypothetical protein